MYVYVCVCVCVCIIIIRNPFKVKLKMMNLFIFPKPWIHRPMLQDQTLGVWRRKKGMLMSSQELVKAVMLGSSSIDDDGGQPAKDINDPPVIV